MGDLGCAHLGTDTEEKWEASEHLWEGRGGDDQVQEGRKEGKLWATAGDVHVVSLVPHISDLLVYVDFLCKLEKGRVPGWCWAEQRRDSRAQKPEAETPRDQEPPELGDLVGKALGGYMVVELEVCLN